MRIKLLILVTGILLLLPLSVSIAQPSGGGPPNMEQAIQNNSRMLADVHANPQVKNRVLARLKDVLGQRGVGDADSRLAEIGSILDEAAAMSDADFEQSRQQLALRIIAQMRPDGAVPSSENDAAPAAMRGPRSAASHIKGGASASSAESIRWIDVHNHLIPGERRDFSGSFDAAVDVMDEIGISRMIVMLPPQNSTNYDYDAFISALRKKSGRFAFLGGGGSLNVMIQQTGEKSMISDSLRQKFEQKADEILRQGAVGFGEMAIHHLSLHGEDHPYESVPADHPLMLMLADIAARNQVPIDVHFDVVTKDIQAPGWLNSPNNPRIFRANLAAFERLLDHNPNAKICWAHAGSDNIGHWTTDLSRKLLQRHANLYMSLRLGPGHAPENFPLTPDRKIKSEWLRLLKDFSDRFVIGSDNFIASPSFHGKGTASKLAEKIPQTRELTPIFLNVLPPDLARKIAYENAIVLYHLDR